MASPNPMDMIAKGLTCNICLNLLRDPKDLDCPHTYCFDCLKQYVQKKPIVECPECRHITTVPKGGLSDLKSNLRLKNLIENFIKDACPRSSTKQIEVPMCPNHIGERQYFFCVTCNVSVCHDCRMIKHPKPQHEIREWKEVMEEEMQRLKKNQELDDVESKLKLAKDKAKEEVKNHVQFVTTEMKAWEKKIDQDIEATYQNRIKVLQEKRIEWNRPTSRGMSKPLLQQDDALPHDMTILQEKPGQLFKLGQLNLSDFGELVTSDNGIPISSADQKQVASADEKQVGSDNKELNLTILTQIGGFIYDAGSVATNRSNLLAVGTDDAISIYDYGKCNGKYKRQCSLRLDSRQICCSIVISSQDKCLVADGGVVKIFSSAGKHESSWPRSVDVCKIAITPDDMVVIGHLSGDLITVHQWDGEMIRTHQVDCRNIKGIVSNGKQIAFTTKHIRVIDFVTGDTLWTLSMSNACGICYEQTSNSWLVTSFSTSRRQGVIEQYCSTTGRLISCLANGLQHPNGITVTHDKKLVVADGRTVKVYNIN